MGGGWVGGCGLWVWEGIETVVVVLQPKDVDIEGKGNVRFSSAAPSCSKKTSCSVSASLEISWPSSSTSRFGALSPRRAALSVMRARFSSMDDRNVSRTASSSATFSSQIFPPAGQAPPSARRSLSLKPTSSRSPSAATTPRSRAPRACRCVARELAGAALVALRRRGLVRLRGGGEKS